MSPPAQTLKIMMLSTSMGMGGADRQVLDVGWRLMDRGHSVRVVSLVRLGPMGLQAREKGMDVTSLGMKEGVADPRAGVSLLRELRKWRPQVLHSHMVHANLLARMMRLLVDIPVVVSTVHNIYEGGRLRELGYRLTDRLCDLTTAVSQAARDRYVRIKAVPEERIRVVVNGIDFKRFPDQSESRARYRNELGVGEAFLWLAVGRLQASKDYPNLIRAFHEVQARHAASSLYIAGEGELRPAITKLINDLSLQHSVRLLGNWDNIPALMNAADGFVLSSSWEGLPIVLLEASAIGLPIVATDVGGVGEIVQAEETGLLVPRRNAGKLSEAMIEIMEKPMQARNEMAQKAKKRVKLYYDVEEITCKWEKIYRDLLEKRRV